MKVYLKNSFYRFGDDLTELILQYLTFEDKIRLECVSKQWQRIIYNKQFVIEIVQTKISFRRIYKKSDSLYLSINRIALKSVLNKCPNIIEVILDFDANNEVLSLIGRYCHRIKRLKLTVIRSDDKIIDFFRIYGYKLEELELNNNWIKDYEEYKKILKFCPNLSLENLIEIFFLNYHFSELKTYFL